MKFLSSEKLSAHKYKTPEGYLICTDAILARTGKQTYRRCEVFADAADDESEIEIDRKAEEVFAPATLASFENKPVTVEHPDENVTPDNYNNLSVGFVRDVRRGEINGQEVMLGTLVITDAQTIEEIENGEHTDLSCGYDCDIVDEANPQQRNIRGNHVALCEQGRAGIARIVDSIMDNKFNIGEWVKYHSYGFNSWVKAYIKEKTKIGYKIRTQYGFEEDVPEEYLEKFTDSIKDDIVFDYTKEDLEKAKAMYEKATEEHEKQLLKTLIDKIEFELKSREMSDSKCKDTKYGIISVEAWKRGSRKPQVVEYDLDSAKRTKFSMENTDRINYVIFNMDTNEFVDSKCKDDEEISVWKKKVEGAGTATSAILRTPSGYYFKSWHKGEDEYFKTLIEAEKYATSHGYTKDSIKDSYYIVACEEGDYWFNEEGKPDKISKAKRFNSYEEADRWRRQKGSGSVQKINDSVKDVDPREGESKEDFIARFMSETKEEYPDEKQRFAVANSYWERKHTKDSKYTIRYVDKDTVYIRTIKAKSKLDAIKKMKDFQSKEISLKRIEEIPLKARMELDKSKDKKATLIGIESNIDDIIEAADPENKQILVEKKDKILSDLKKQFNI